MCMVSRRVIMAVSWFRLFPILLIVFPRTQGSGSEFLNSCRLCKIKMTRHIANGFMSGAAALFLKLQFDPAAVKSDKDGSKPFRQ